jgi:hypothetical protein
VCIFFFLRLFALLPHSLLFVFAAQDCASPLLLTLAHIIIIYTLFVFLLFCSFGGGSQFLLGMVCSSMCFIFRQRSTGNASAPRNEGKSERRNVEGVVTAAEGCLPSTALYSTKISLLLTISFSLLPVCVWQKERGGGETNLRRSGWVALNGKTAPPPPFEPSRPFFRIPYNTAFSMQRCRGDCAPLAKSPSPRGSLFFADKNKTAALPTSHHLPSLLSLFLSLHHPHQPAFLFDSSLFCPSVLSTPHPPTR